MNWRFCFPAKPGAALMLALACGGCVGPERQRLVSKPNMQFSRNAAFNYSSRLMSQIQPGLAATGGAQASTCTICK